jgi:hypothetical protein
MNDDFFDRFRKTPSREFSAALYERINQPVVKKENSKFHSRLFTASAATLLLVVVLLATNPQVRAFAQTILQFFTPAQATTFPLPTPHNAPEPTLALAAPPITGCENPSDALTYACTIAAAEAALGFEVKQLPSAPQDFTFAGVFFDPAQGRVQLTYTRDGSEITITEIKGSTLPTDWESTWGAVPAGSVEPVKINTVDGEYVRGMFVVKSQSGTNAEWEPDAPVQRLRWRENGTTFDIFIGGMTTSYDIGKEWLVNLAESLK